MNTITLKRADGMWTATFSGPHAAEVVDLFGTATLPTPYSDFVNVELVAQVLGDRNPTAYIEVA